MPYNASSARVESELEELATVDDVLVQRSLVDENEGYTWTVTFSQNLGDLPLLEVDSTGLEGTLAGAVVEEQTRGA